MSDHLSADTVSDLMEGLFNAVATAGAETHLADCSQCTELRERLRSVSSVLGSLPGPGPMPDDVAARIDAALRDAREESGKAAASEPHSAVVGLDSARERRRAPRSTRFLQAAAAFVLIAGAGAIIVPQVLESTSNSGSQSATSGGSTEMDTGGESAGAPRVTASGRDYTDATVGPAAVMLAAGRAPAPTVARNSASPTVAPNAPQPATEGDGTADQASRLSEPTALASCVATLVGPGVVPVAVDIARFEGQPAGTVPGSAVGVCGRARMFCS